METGESNTVTGQAEVVIVDSYCSESTAARFLCATFVASDNVEPPMDDTDASNDVACVDITPYLNCADGKSLYISTVL